MTDATQGHLAYRRWTDHHADWTRRGIKGLHLTEEIAQGLRDELLIMLEVAMDARNDFVISDEVLLSLHGELNALFKGFEPMFLIPESRRHPNKRGSPQTHAYIQDAIAWIRASAGLGHSISEARASVREIFGVAKSTVSAWEARYPDYQDATITEGRMKTAGRLYRDYVSST
jgi:hypothetical protein